MLHYGMVLAVMLFRSSVVVATMLLFVFVCAGLLAHELGGGVNFGSHLGEHMACVGELLPIARYTARC